MTRPVLIATFDDRWARWQAAAAEQDRTWRRVAIGAAVIVGVSVLLWLAVALSRP